MTPQKRVKADVQKILDNPVQSDAQQAIAPKKEGFWGWMSYVGWTLCLWFMFDMLDVFRPIHMDERNFLIFLGTQILEFLDDFKGLVYTVLFLLWFMSFIIFYKSPYPLVRSFFYLLFFYLFCAIHFGFWIIGAGYLKVGYVGYVGYMGVIFVYCMLLFEVLFYRFSTKIAIGITAAFFVGSLIIVLNDIFFKMQEDYFVMLFYIPLPIFYLYYFYKKSKDGYRYVWLKVLVFPLLLFIPSVEKRVPPFHMEGALF